MKLMTQEISANVQENYKVNDVLTKKYNIEFESEEMNNLNLSLNLKLLLTNYNHYRRNAFEHIVYYNGCSRISDLGYVISC